MALNFDKLKQRLEKAQGKGSTNNNFWKIEEGTHTVRIVDTGDGDPFKDYFFHYNVGDAAGFLCPKHNFNEECPVCDFASKLWRDDDGDSKEQAKKLFKKQRFFAPVLVRGEEDAGIRVWGFGKRAYETMLGLALNPEYGDITDVETGTDLDVSYETKKGERFPTTTITPKRKSSKLCKDLSKKECEELLATSPKFEELFERKTTAEVETLLNQWLSADDSETTGDEGKKEVQKYNKGDDTETEENPVDKAFDELLND
jgi:hypothetical protein